MRFTLAYIFAASIVIKGSPAAVVLRSLTKRASRSGTLTPDPADLRKMIAVFLRLRPFLPHVKASRWIEQITLFKLLRNGGVPANLVLGISMDPLKIYSWIQYQDVVIDEASEVAASFSPIMVA
jgi:hypothetical protein